MWRAEAHAFSLILLLLVSGATFAQSPQILFEYDAARRLTTIADSLGNTVSYTLDAAGNRIGEQLTDPGGHLKKREPRACL